MSPAGAHLPRRTWDASSAKLAVQIFYTASPIIIVQPVFQIMQTRKIIAGAFSAAVSVQLDVVQQTFRSPVRFRLIEHSGKTESDLEKGPAIHSLKVY